MNALEYLGLNDLQLCRGELHKLIQDLHTVMAHVRGNKAATAVNEALNHLVAAQMRLDETD